MGLEGKEGQFARVGVRNQRISGIVESRKSQIICPMCGWGHAYNCLGGCLRIWFGLWGGILASNFDLAEEALETRQVTGEAGRKMKGGSRDLSQGLWGYVQRIFCLEPSVY